MVRLQRLVGAEAGGRGGRSKVRGGGAPAASAVRVLVVVPGTTGVVRGTTDKRCVDA
jgi:hypothetical protein